MTSVFIIFASTIFLAYFLPTMIASGRDTKHTVLIFLINLFFGWTFLGWVVAFILSICLPKRDAEDRPLSQAVIDQVMAQHANKIKL